MNRVPENVQEMMFTQILSRPENKTCADCNAKSPNWCSIDFGVVICLQCAGAHRQLGPSVTRVRSAKLDSWEIEDINIISATGNKIANHYWENKMPKHFKRLEVGLPMDEVKNYIFEKYVKKSFVSPTVKHPVREYLAAVKARDITPGEFYKTYLKKIDENTPPLGLEKSKSSGLDFSETFKLLSAKPFSSTGGRKTQEEGYCSAFNQLLKSSDSADTKSLFDSFKAAPYENRNMNINQPIVSSHQIPTYSAGQKISQIQQHPQANTISNSPSQVIYNLYKQPSNQPSNGPQRANLPLANNLNIITHNQKNQQQSCVQNFGNNCNPQNHHLSFAGHSQQNTRTPYNSAQCSAEGVLSSQNPFLSFGISAPSKQNFGYSNSSQNVHPLTNVDNPWAHTLMATTQNSWI